MCTPREIKSTWIAVFIFFAIFVVIYFPASTVHRIQQDEMGVNYNKYTEALSGPYFQGSYTLKPGEDFILFKRTVQDSLTQSISCLTRDKLALALSISVQYYYDSDALIPIVLRQFGSDEHFKVLLYYVARSTVSNTCVEFTAEEYYTKRSMVDQTMRLRLYEVVGNLSIGVSFENFQLVNIQYPSAFSTVISDKQTAEQELTTATFERTTLLTNAATALKEAEQTATVTLINANTTATAVLDAARVNREVTIDYWEQKGLSYQSIKSQLALNDTGLIRYIKAELFKATSSPIVNVALD